MTEISEQAQYIEELQAEAGSLPESEREANELIIAEFVAELALKEAAQRQAMQAVESAKNWESSQGNEDSASVSVEVSKEKSVEVDFDKIGWIGKAEKSKLPTESVETNTGAYNFVDLTSLSRRTAQTVQKLQKQTDDKGNNVYETLYSIVKETVIPTLHDNIIHGNGKLRPVSIGGRKVKDVPADQSLNTSYPAYKEGVHGPQNRAIILKLGDDTEGMPTYALAALYDHDDDKGIHNTLFIKQL